MSQLRVSGLSKAFGGLMAVTNVGFEIGPGQILGLIGRNGAGKTSVFNLFSGFLSPHQSDGRLRGDANPQGTTLARRKRFEVARALATPRKLPFLGVVLAGPNPVEVQDALPSSGKSGKWGRPSSLPPGDENGRPKAMSRKTMPMRMIKVKYIKWLWIVRLGGRFLSFVRGRPARKGAWMM